MGWQEDFLSAIGAPATPNNLGNVNAWAQCEGGLSNNNPFNTTKGGPGASGSINSVGVKRFDSLSNGVAANVATIQQSNFSPLLNALKTDANRADFAATLGAVPWGTNPKCVSSANGKAVGGAPAQPAPSSSSGGAKGCFATAPLVGGCIIGKSQLKAVRAALAIGAGAAIMAVGTILLVSGGAKGTGAGRAVVRTASRVPLAGRVPTSYSRPRRSADPGGVSETIPKRDPNVASLSPEMRRHRERFKARERAAAPQRDFDAETADVDMF